jgi:hypothetical protein
MESFSVGRRLPIVGKYKRASPEGLELRNSTRTGGKLDHEDSEELSSLAQEALDGIHVSVA